MDAKVKGIICFGAGVTLREGDREYFYQKLDEHFPGLKKRYCETYGNAYELPIPNQAAWMRVFTETCEKYGILCTPDECFRYLHELPQRSEQISLF